MSPPICETKRAPRSSFSRFRTSPIVQWRSSSGEAKRILIARALVHRPKALLLDEPSNSLDVFAQHELREILRKLASTGIGILLVTHHLADIIPEIDRVILLRGGRIVADGQKQDVLTAPILSDVFGLPVELSRREGYYHLW